MIRLGIEFAVPYFVANQIMRLQEGSTTGLEQQDLSTRNWYVVYTKPRKEENAEFHLRTKGIEVFNPRLYLPEVSRRRKRVVPLFPSYLFVKINLFSDEYYWVTWCQGVKRFVSFDETPSSVDNKVVSFLKEQTNSSGFIPAQANLSVGQEVQIEDGPFKGLMGMIQEPPDDRGRVRVLMTLLSRPLNVKVATSCVKVAWVPPYKVQSQLWGSQIAAARS